MATQPISELLKALGQTQGQKNPLLQAPEPFKLDVPAVEAPRMPMAGPVIDPAGRAPQDILAAQQRVADTSVPVEGPGVISGAFEGLSSAAGRFVDPEVGPSQVIGEQLGGLSDIAGEAATGLLGATGLESPQQRILREGEVPAPPVPMATPESIADLSFTGTPLTPETITEAGAGLEAPQAAAAPQGLTTVGGAPLSEFLAGGTPLGGRGDSGSAGAQALEDAGVLAGTRPRADGTFVEREVGAPTSRDRGDGMSFDEARRQVPRVEGETAREYNERVKAFAATGGVAPDTRTPDEIESDRLAREAQELANKRTQQIIEQGNQPNATPFQKKRGEWEERAETLREDGASEAEITARRKAFLFGDTFDPFPFEGGAGDSTKEATPSDAGSTPATSTTERQAFDTMEEAQAANLPAGTKITIGGRNATT